MKHSLLRFISIVFITLGLSACAGLNGFNRSMESGYAVSDDAPSESQNFYNSRRQQEVSMAREELGMAHRPLAEQDQERLQLRLKLKRAEARLKSQRDKAQYYKIRSFLKNDPERLYFLALPSFEAKERWLSNRGLMAETQKFSPEVNKNIENKDISIGMNQQAVSESWGDPDLVEVAGDPVYGYERWLYHRFNGDSEGFEKEQRVVFFEGGRVVGWETGQ